MYCNGEDGCAAMADKPLEPTAEAALTTGFPSPAADYAARRLDLNDLLVRHPVATFFWRAQGAAMQADGIHHNDILIVDRALTATPGHIVIVCLNGESLVRRLRSRQGRFVLQAGPVIEPLAEDSDMEIWGVVTYVIHPCI